MPHPLVTQLRFTRSEFLRALDGIADPDARHRFEPMNSISWIIGHLANQEHAYWVMIAQGKTVVSGLNNLVGFGKPASTPPLDEMWTAWRQTTSAADPFLETLSAGDMPTHLTWQDQPRPETIGTMLMRNIYHYWFHTGEAYAIRQLLGHKELPEFVGNIEAAIYRPE